MGKKQQHTEETPFETPVACNNTAVICRR